jgi:hypothetical protein
MTEEEWRTSRDIWQMLQQVQTQATERKWRLLCCACCRRIWDQLPDARSRNAVAVAEQYADELVNTFTLLRHRDDAFGAFMDGGLERSLNLAVLTAEPYGKSNNGYAHAMETIQSLDALLDQSGGEVLCHLVRHLFGTPFHSYPALAAWPSPVVKLAEAMYAGEDCSFALHDALLEAGHPDLAEHFKEKEHPKGCWVLDLILGKR